MKYIEFVFKMGASVGRKTGVWEVTNIRNRWILGVVKWHSHWRQYCFYTMSDGVLSVECLQDIAKFLEEKTVAHRNRSKGPDGRRDG